MTALTVHGGAGGIVAECDEITTLAHRMGGAAAESATSSWSLHGYLADPELLASALLDPAGWAAFEATLLDALDGPAGLSAAAAQCAALDVELRAAAVGYETVDRLAVDEHDLANAGLALPGALTAGITRLVEDGPRAGFETLLVRDPEFGDVAVVGLTAAIGRHRLTALDEALPDGRGIARPLGVDRSESTPPRDLVDVLRGIARRNRDPHHGSIDVRLLTLADGSRRAIVDVTGTKSWDPLPTGDVTSLTTNARSILGLPCAYEAGVLAAMRRAGVRPDEPVMLVGHSQGGMIAVDAARTALRTGEFRVTDVITAGSPIGHTVGRLPSSVRVLALENERDLIPHLDGAANPDRRNVTTVSGVTGDGSVLGDHSLEHGYLPLARQVEHDDDESVRTFLRGARDYFRGREVVTMRYQVVRSYR